MSINTLPEIIFQAANRSPDREAFTFLTERLSYSRLFEKISRLVTVLTSLGVRRYDRVGIWMHKSLESVIALYATMLVGGIYVPLDPAAPVDRVWRIIQDCSIRHIVTHPLMKHAFQELQALQPPLEGVIGLDPIPNSQIPVIGWQETDEIDAARLPFARVLEQDPAYIMYTSGSTGEPKGIMHTHASGLAYARQAAMTYGLKPDDRLANFAPLHFDQSTFEMFAGPLAQATTVIIPEMHMKLPASLTQLMVDEKITVWYSVPFALIQMLLRGVLEERELGSIRWVLYGGEPFPPKYLYALMAQWPQARFSNVYGPTEVNQCTYYHVPPEPEDQEAPIPIGRIWENAEGLIVDEQDTPVPAGQPGELLVRSPTMMAGYWGRSYLDEDYFFRREIVPGFTQVFYRTGDLVCERPDGVLDFLGRMDRQIKTRGFRVELDEVEAVLSGHPLVEEAAVYTVMSSEGSRAIEAAVITKNFWAGLENELRSFLMESLPIYAIPEHIAVREAFPRTSSGKINRRQLQLEADMTNRME